MPERDMNRGPGKSKRSNFSAANREAVRLGAALVFLALQTGTFWANPADTERGKDLYRKNCAQCHGSLGDGQGPAAERLHPKPRDFTLGDYKLRSTPSGELPTDEDLYRAIAEGLPGSSMPGWKEALSKKEIGDLVAYLKTFSERFEEDPPPGIVELGPPVKATAQSVALGRELYNQLGCFQCHGQQGRGDGPSAPSLEDDRGHPTVPANFHKRWSFRAGNRREDMVRTLLTGFNGTPMPSFLDAFGEGAEGRKKAWDLANYIHSLSKEAPQTNQVLSSSFVEGPLPQDPSDPIWQKAQKVDFPLAGQIVEEPRLFHPSIDLLSARSLYNQKEIAWLLEWDDPTQSLGKDEESDPLPDAVQIQIPVQLTSGDLYGEKPYFLEGDLGHPVHLWYWNAKTDSVTQFQARGLSHKKEKITQTLFTSRSQYSQGQWRLLLKRPLNPKPQPGIAFQPQIFVPIAFSAWNGSKQETQTLRSVSSWYYLYLEPAASKTVYAYPLLTLLLIGGLEFWILKKTKRTRSQSRSVS